MLHWKSKLSSILIPLAGSNWKIFPVNDTIATRYVRSIMPQDFMESIGLDNTRLFGMLPSELGLLTALSDIRLTNNFVFRSIPSELGMASNLSNCNISCTEITGSVPEVMCRRTQDSFPSVDCDNVACNCCRTEPVIAPDPRALHQLVSIANGCAM